MGRPRFPKEKLDLTGMTTIHPQRYEGMGDSSLIAFPENTSGIEPTIKLTKRTKQAWDITIPSLLKMRILAPCDLMLLEKGFEALDECNKAQEALKKFDRDTKDIPITDKIKDRQRLRSWYRDSLADSVSIFCKFGLTPSSRSSLQLTPVEDKKVEDPLDILIEGEDK